MDSDGLPTLLMQAARSAAAADGVPAPKQEDSFPKLHIGGGNPMANLNNGMVNGAALSNMQNQIMNGSINNVNPMNGSMMPPNQVTSSSMGGAVRDDEALSESPEVNVTTASAGMSKGEDSGNRRKAPLRRGKWTPEEEAYANRLIQEFKAGLLPLTDGTTLRTFLSKLLNCDPMRISKKFVGSNCIGKQVFRRRGADVNNLTPEEIQQTRLELSELEKKFLDRVAQNKSKGSSSGGGGGRNSTSNNTTKPAPAQDSKPPPSSNSMGGMSGLSATNTSAAAAGRALLQGGSAQNNNQKHNIASAGGGGMMGGGNNNGGGLLAQLQASQAGAGSNNAGMNREQMNQLAQSKGLSSSASLANMLGKKRSFDGLMTLDFQSMQSIDNLANLIQAGLPNQAPSGGIKNFDWGNLGNNSGSAQNSNNNSTSFGSNSQASNRTSNTGSSSNQGGQGTLETLVRNLSNPGSSMAHGGATVANQTNANFGNFLQGVQHGNASAPGSNNNNNQDFNTFLQNLQQQNQQSNNAGMGGQNINYGNILQGMQNQGAGGGNNIEALLQNMQNNNNNSASGSNNSGNAAAGNNSGNTNSINANFGNDFSGFQQMQGGRNPNGGNDLFNNLMGGSGMGNQQNFNPLAQLNDPFNGLQQGQNNPMMALAQQQLFAQAGGGNPGMANLFAQQNGLAGLAGMGNNFGNFGGNNMSSNNMGGSNFSGGAPNTAVLLQQLLSQQSNNVGGGSNSNTPGIAQQGQHQQQFSFGGQSGTLNANQFSNNKRDFGNMNGGDGNDSKDPSKKSCV